GSDCDLLRTSNACISRILPINMEFPCEDGVIFKDLFQLRAPRRHYDIRRASRRQTPSIKVRGVQEIDTVDDHTLLSGRLAPEHPGAIGDADMLLDDFVARARGSVVAVGPNRRSRIIGKQRPEEFIPIIRTKRIRTRADRITHRVGTLGARLSALV